MPAYMTNENYHCLDINYKTEMELRAISTYLFVFIVLSSFFYLQLNRFMTQEIRHLNRELYFIGQKLKSETAEEASGSGSDSSDSGDDSSIVVKKKNMSRKLNEKLDSAEDDM